MRSYGLRETASRLLVITHRSADCGFALGFSTPIPNRKQSSIDGVVDDLGPYQYAKHKESISGLAEKRKYLCLGTRPTLPRLRDGLACIRLPGGKEAFALSVNALAGALSVIARPATTCRRTGGPTSTSRFRPQVGGRVIPIR